MAPKTKINLKDRFEDGELDLSLSELQEVPVREIVCLFMNYNYFFVAFI